MNHIVNAFKNLPRRGQHNFVKILCLSLGLAISSVIIAEIYFEQTYDTYFKGWDRTYQISEVGNNQGQSMHFNHTSGATAHGVKSYAPMVEAATRIRGYQEGAQCKFEDQSSLNATMILADSCFFDVFPQKMLVGNAKQALSQPMSCVVSSEWAEKVGGNVVGKRFTTPNSPGRTFVIGGVFESFPWGSSFHGKDVIISLDSTPSLFSFDGRDQWVGNDCYESYIRLAKGHKSDELKPFVEKMRKDNFPLKEMRKMGIELNYDFTVLSDVYTHNSYIKMMGWIMAIIAFVLLFTSVMNYLLIIVGNLVTRSREMAVRKCYGAEPINIHAIIFSEALVHVGLSVILSAILVFLCKGSIENFLSAPVATLVFNRGSWILVVICLFVLFIGGFVPGYLYNKIPVAIAFRGYNENRNRWKLALLGIQFVISGLLFSLLFVVNNQYLMMLFVNPGYNYKNVALLMVDGIDGDQRDQCLAEIRRMPDVEGCASSTAMTIPGYHTNGDMINIEGDPDNTFNVIENGGVDDNYFNLMQIPIVEGTSFTERSDSSRQVMIDEQGAEKLKKMGHWKDGVIGKKINSSGWGDANGNLYTFTICGVVKHIQWGDLSMNNSEMKTFPMLYFYSAHTAPYMLIKFKNLTDDALSDLYNRVKAMYPNSEVRARNYEVEYENQYASQRKFRNGILVGGIITMVIALFGLVGYTSDEVNRRRKEIAIRKVNGAKVSDILRIFLKDIVKIALPCIVIGDIVAWVIARQWLMSFSIKASLTPLEFIYVTIALLLIIGIAVVVNCYKVANGNPVKYLKDE